MYKHWLKASRTMLIDGISFQDFSDNKRAAGNGNRVVALFNIVYIGDSKKCQRYVTIECKECIESNSALICFI
jgi:hypothetical protein